MSIYQSIARFGPAFVSKQTLFKAGFNLSPMYRRSTGRIISVSSDLHEVKIILPISYRNRNYVGSIFGGSLFSAVDPIPMVQLINILGNDYVVWDKSASIQFKAPAKEDVYAEFQYTKEELSDIKGRVARDREIEVCKVTLLKDKSGSRTFCAVDKTLYVADKVFYKEKLRARKAAQG